MEMKFLTLLNDHNDWLDWVMCWGYNVIPCEDMNEPEKFPCYVSDKLVGYDDREPLFAPHFLYFEEVKEMFEALES